MKTTMGRLTLALGLVAGVFVVGTIGYWLLGFSPLDALYQTTTTVTTVGFEEVEPFGTAEKWFSIFLILTGVGVALYSLSLVVQLVVEGQLRDLVGRRRMDKQISNMSGHIVVCGWGRVGRTVASHLAIDGMEVVVVEQRAEMVESLPFPTVIGDATLDSTLRAAGIDRAAALIAALEGDAENLFVTLSGRELRPDLFIVARARQHDSVPKLEHAGADRVVNPQELGAARMASFVARPHIAEFVDVVMHERSLDFQMQELEVSPGSTLAGRTLGEVDLPSTTGCLVLAIRRPDGAFDTNPGPETVLEPHHIVIVVGTDEDLARLFGLDG
ncbi:MAG: potassium channel family protein [Ilumatobacteraceae bacterium]